MNDKESKQKEINEKCLAIINDFGDLAHSIELDVFSALRVGLEDRDYSQNDYAYLEKVYKKFYSVYEQIPDFRDVALSNIPIGCNMEFENSYPCSECQENIDNYCRRLRRSEKIRELLTNNDIEGATELLKQS